MFVEESIHVIFDEANTHLNMQELDNHDFDIGLIRYNDQDEEIWKQFKETTTTQEEEQRANTEVLLTENLEEVVTEELALVEKTLFVTGILGFL